MTRLMIENSNLDNETTHLTGTSPIPAFKERICLFISRSSFDEGEFYKEDLVEVELILFSD